MELIIAIIAGLVAGGVSLYAILRGRVVRLETQLDKALGERDERTQELANANIEIARYESAQAEREKAFAERLAEIDTRFKGLASEVLKSSTEEFRKQAAEQFKQQQALADKDLKARETAVENLVKPVRESLNELRKHVDKSNEARSADTAKVSQSVEQLMAETSGLRKILHNPQLRGEWGEQHLRNVLDAAGMSQHVDYEEQAQVKGDGARLRPDVLVRIPGGATVVIDAKTPFDRYDAAMRSEDEQEQKQLLKEHATALVGHAKVLADRDYAQWIEGSPDFVMMYVPTDPMLDAAINAEPAIWQKAWEEHRVLIATPGLLIAFLRTVALAWRQQDIQENAQKIAGAARELYSRLRTYASHVDKMGRGLQQAIGAYNAGVGSFQSRVLVQARQFEELGAADKSGQIGEFAPVDETVRRLQAPELPFAPDAEDESV
ncbi:MAG: DNA recombination protein RmuC [Bacteroidetes bacterium SB0662_bin_6]|nr:DNA recombination protein RmuC [Bacteroidetes bacterium SB0668_bin_1]MYE05500.1 DNA recombination protein RmuC [Bacteroidetes bacterium SB0662_bin_6]